MSGSEARCIADIEGPWVEPELNSGLTQRLSKNWSVPVDQVDNHALATFLRQLLGLAVAIPEAESRVAAGYHDDSELFDEELKESLLYARTHCAPEIAATRRWLERAVIGLNLCPFAKAVYVKQQVRFVLSDAEHEDDLLEELAEELLRLRDTPADEIDTTLLVHPEVLGDFLDYNDFLDRVDDLIEALELDGTLQVASFHPDYRFADSVPDDPGNGTNRAPYPTLHLLREASIDRAVAAYPDADVIVQRNLETMERLGLDGLQRLLGQE